jgi:hypothetical protein
VLGTPLLATSRPSAHPASQAALTPAEASELSCQGIGHTSEAKDYFPPVTSAVVVPQMASSATASITKAAREQFIREHLPTRIQAQLDQSYGKDTLSQSFFMPAHFRVVLLLLFKSLFCVIVRGKLWKVRGASLVGLHNSSSTTVQSTFVLSKVSMVNGRMRQISTGTANLWPQRAVFTSANGDIASIIRYIGGPHVGAHRNTDAILKRLAGKIDDEIHSDLTRIFTSGSPAYCNAESSEANFQEYVKYGNHKSMEADPAATRKSLLKESKRGYVLLMDPQILQFLLHAHITPNGIIGADHPTKSPRVIFDSTFRLTVWSSAINNWTSKYNEPPLAFASPFNDVLVWIWNLRIS